MPRLLPWLANGDNKKKQERITPASTPTRRSRLRTPSPRASNGRSGEKKKPTLALEETPRQIDFLRSSRSPPTSPVEAPPVEEYIKEGFDNDDMYIMVEDEFYAVAQQFTRHLHHAEYVRRKKEAKKMSTSVLRDMARPIDTRTPMSKELLKRKESERLQARQNKGLAPRSRRPRTDDESGEDEGNDGVAISDVEEEEEEREDDPWYGTSLHTFMASPRKNKSLVGLEGMRVNTRAAAGFRSEVARSPSNLRRSMGSPLHSDDNQVGDTTATATEDDDLEIIESKSSRPNPLPQAAVRVRTSLIKRESPGINTSSGLHKHNTGRANRIHDPNVSNNKRTSTGDSNQGRNPESNNLRAKHSSSAHRNKVATTATKSIRASTMNDRPRKRILLDDLDDDVAADYNNEKTRPTNDRIQDQPRRITSASSAKTSRSTYCTSEEQQQKTAKKSRLEDVPTFLV